jgi:hypothetical protein
MSLNIMEWTEAYLKYKDSIQRKIIKLEKSGNNLVCELKDGSTHKYLCIDDLSSLSLGDLDGFRVSCLNTKKNLDWVVKNWQEIKESDTVFLFANPKKAVHWSVNPKLHDSISDKSAIKQGLKSLFESIPEV